MSTRTVSATPAASLAMAAVASACLAVFALAQISAASTTATSARRVAAPTTADGYRSAYGRLATMVDGGYSTPTPYGVVWTHGDGVPTGRSWASNNVVVQDGGTWTLHSQVVPDRRRGDDVEFWWLGPAVWDGSRLRVLAHHGRRAAAGGAGWTPLGTDLVTLRLSAGGVELEGVTRTPASSEAGTGWSAAMTQDASHVYMYGTRHDAYGCQSVYAARVRRRALGIGSAWTYWNGATWVARRAAATAIQLGRCWGPGFSVHRLADGRWMVVGNEGMSHVVAAFTSTKPTGPWKRTKLFDAGTGAYLALAHPQARIARGTLLVGWSVAGSSIRFAEVAHP